MRCIKKSVDVQAMQYKGSNADEVIKFCEGNATLGTLDEAWKGKNIPEQWLDIQTLEGKVRAEVGDYIIKGVAGEFYPCSRTKFKKLYTHKKGKSYTKKAIVTYCMQFDGTNAIDIAAFCADNKCEIPSSSKDTLIFNNGKDMLVASKGDYIIVGDEGHAYPCKPDIFEKTYEEAIPEWLEELDAEEEILSRKIDALQKLFLNENSMEIVKKDPVELNLLIGQLGAMKCYQSALIGRRYHFYDLMSQKQFLESLSEEKKDK